MSSINLAIVSPNRNAYSETFIQAHKQLPFNISFYYGGFMPKNLEPDVLIADLDVINKIRRRLTKKLTAAEFNLLTSFKSNKIECVLAEYGPTAVSILKVVKYLELPLIVHFHGYDATKVEYLKTYESKYKEVFEYASYIVVVSYKMKQDLLNMGCNEDKLILNPYGPDNLFFEIFPRYINSIFVAIGRFVDKKAPYLTILAFKKVLNSFPNAKLLMGGEGPLLNACKNIVSVCGLNANIEFKSKLTPEEVRLLFAEALGFVQHSVIADDGDSEGTPVAILEAQAAGLPVISTRHAGISDVIVENETGFLVNELDIEGMSAYMIKLLEDRDLARSLGNKAKQRIKSLFTLDKHLLTLAKLVSDSKLK